MIAAFPKIFTLGTKYIQDIFKESVEITEKVDGSQFNFGKIDGVLQIRSKNKELYFDNPEKMFGEAIDYVKSIEDIIPDNTIFHCEYLKKPKHNTLVYERTPRNHLICFGVSSQDQSFTIHYEMLAEKIGIESVPVLFSGTVYSSDKLKSFLETPSILGGTKVEGIVIKNYSRLFLLGGYPIPLMSGKLVSENFKERHGSNKDFKHGRKWDAYKESFRTEARWMKAVQHLKEKGELEGDPRDIGKLIKEVQNDIRAEEGEDIRAHLWEIFGDELIRESSAGLAPWYKERLLDTVLGETNNGN